ncbi:hypothetical protein ES708_32285 [subsurface metagenome]
MVLEGLDEGQPIPQFLPIDEVSPLGHEASSPLFLPGVAVFTLKYQVLGELTPVKVKAHQELSSFRVLEVHPTTCEIRLGIREPGLTVFDETQVLVIENPIREVEA